eukprot:TRINITY_DN1708_c0_g1_i1.p1 TRINITY_DN1708_c0_g1~~TRINITY_DN1708_c0_g1_i1.p1  ORF type:complete len:568 (+),score=38.22 TRINITY_DN1708_c0_g1_i1:63-1766(+)
MMPPDAFPVSGGYAQHGVPPHPGDGRAHGFAPFDGGQPFPEHKPPHHGWGLQSPSLQCGFHGGASRHQRTASGENPPSLTSEGLTAECPTAPSSHPSTVDPTDYGGATTCTHDPYYPGLPAGFDDTGAPSQPFSPTPVAGEPTPEPWPVQHDSTAPVDEAAAPPYAQQTHPRWVPPPQPSTGAMPHVPEPRPVGRMWEVNVEVPMGGAPSDSHSGPSLLLRHGAQGVGRQFVGVSTAVGFDGTSVHVTIRGASYERVVAASVFVLHRYAMAPPQGSGSRTPSERQRSGRRRSRPAAVADAPRPPAADKQKQPPAGVATLKSSKRPRPPQDLTALSECCAFEVSCNGDRVRDLMQAAGWNDGLRRYCGQRGTVVRFDDTDRARRQVRLLHLDGQEVTWPLDSLRPLGTVSAPAAAFIVAAVLAASCAARDEALPAFPRLLPPRPDVCISCGSRHSLAALKQRKGVRLRSYRFECSTCGTQHLQSKDTGAVRLSRDTHLATPLATRMAAKVGSGLAGSPHETEPCGSFADRVRRDAGGEGVQRSDSRELSCPIPDEETDVESAGRLDHV